VVEGWMPEGEVTLLAGHGGGGKSIIALQLAVCVALGRDIFGLSVQRRKVLFWSLEDPAARLWYRIDRACRSMSAALSDLDGSLFVADGSGADGELARSAFRGERAMSTTPAYAELVGQLHETGADVFIVDGASDAFGGNENDRRQVRTFIRLLHAAIPSPRGAALLVAHVDKLSARNTDTTQGYSGSTAWHNSVRSRWYFRLNDGGGMTLELQKLNVGPAGGAIDLKWDDEAKVFKGRVVTAESVADAQREAERRIVAMIGEAESQEAPIGAERAGRGSTYAAMRYLDGFPPAIKSSSDLWKMLDRLKGKGRIRFEIVKTKDYKQRHVLKVGEPESPEEPF
jgi:RecA-family ATPase